MATGEGGCRCAVEGLVGSGCGRCARPTGGGSVQKLESALGVVVSEGLRSKTMLGRPLQWLAR